MERGKEIRKLVNVLYRIARGASYVSMGGGDAQAARFCVEQYNRVLGRLIEVEPAAAEAFTRLDTATSPEVVRIAAREVAAYFEDEAGEGRRGRHTGGCGAGVWVGSEPIC